MIHVVTIPPPAPSPKLRVYVAPFTTFAERKHGRPGWDTPHEEFVKNQVRLIEKYLAQTGIYEIVSKEDVRGAIGDQKLTRFQMERNDWALAKKIGHAVHADYVMIMERGSDSLLRERYFFNVLINVETGRKFGVQYSFQWGGRQGQMREIVHASYRDIFRSAMDDLLTTALKKGQQVGSAATYAQPPAFAVSPVKQPEERPKLAKQPAQPIAPKTSIQPSPSSAPQPKVVASAPLENGWLQKRDVEEALTQDEPAPSGKKLVVYDLDASEQFRPAALIFSEALREEIFKLKKYILVNREDLDRVLKEMALQQTGLIDEKEAVKTGIGLAANQVVTGRMGLLGKTFVLQAKRIDVKTFETLGLASTKFSQGHEDEAFDTMHNFALQLTAP
jgi:hypothetical protein